jgi:hypothetical protein
MLLQYFMKFSQHRFMQEIGVRIPFEMAWFHRAGVVYLIAPFPVRREFLQTLVSETLLATLPETPGGTLLDTLLDTLDILENYVKINQQTHTSEAGERETLYEYQLHINTVQRLVNRVYLFEEMCHALQVIEQDDFVSVRLLQQKMMMTGRTVPHRRASDILWALEQEGYLETNGFRRTRGREIVRREHLQAD